MTCILDILYSFPFFYLDFFIGDEAVDKPNYATKVKLQQQFAF